MSTKQKLIQSASMKIMNTISGSKIVLVYVLVFIVFSKPFDSRAQGEANIWYFGWGAGVDFNSGNPVALTNGHVFTMEGCATMSDASGNLLFYTDGTTVWNSVHDTMLNGDNLLGNSTSTQSAIIIKKPGSYYIYYIFTVAGYGGPDGLRYSEVDMSLNGGLGGITLVKNVLLTTPVSEKLTAIKKVNSNDFWVIVHDYYTDAFFSYSVTGSGVEMTPVVSHAGTIDTLQGAGYLNASPDATKLVQAHVLTNSVDVLNFDVITGIVTTDFIIAPPFNDEYPYGVEFSPDGSRLYVAYITTLYQYNMALVDSSYILASVALVATTVNGLGALQTGPNGKIYVTKFYGQSLGCIANPNLLGAGCNFIEQAVPLGGWESSYGLPNFATMGIPTDCSMSQQPITASFSTSPATSLTANTPIAFVNSSVGSTAFFWNFGDSLSGADNTSSSIQPFHTYTRSGNYCICLMAISDGGCSDTVTKCMSVEDNLLIPNIFTPNGDGKNDVFLITGSQSQDISVQIYSRWGTLIYESFNYNNDWDGTNCTDGVYYYMINCSATEKIYTGYVQIISSG